MFPGGESEGQRSEWGENYSILPGAHYGLLILLFQYSRLRDPKVVATSS